MALQSLPSFGKAFSRATAFLVGTFQRTLVFKVAMKPLPMTVSADWRYVGRIDQRRSGELPGKAWQIEVWPLAGATLHGNQAEIGKVIHRPPNGDWLDADPGGQPSMRECGGLAVPAHVAMEAGDSIHRRVLHFV